LFAFIASSAQAGGHDCEELVVEFKEKSNHFFLHHLQ